MESEPSMFLNNTMSREVDVCIVGGGMAGLCAALASARQGAKTCLVHDRPVLGGNASSEIRMWICGAHGQHNKETGLLEEIQLENLRRNPSLNYSIWDGVLYGFAFHQPNLTTLLNTTCLDAACREDRIESIRCWTLTSQCQHIIQANVFIDCSGDSILAPLTGAKYRCGREGRDEYHESIAPERADSRTMGNSLLIQIRRTDEPQPFVAPDWAYRFDSPDQFAHRVHGVQAQNFWWLEVGGLEDTIADAESIRDELMRIVYGVWDYLKNRSPEKDQSVNWAIEWIGSLAGKRENRRYVGDHILTQNDLVCGGRFEDIVAYGGWPMDDHHPAGLYHPGEPTVFHPTPSPYGIPYRSLYSCNIQNLMFAGRNISATHWAMASTRVMATCSLMGQAVGTAAAMSIQSHVLPRALATGDHLHRLQQQLMQDDVWLPGRLRTIHGLAKQATLDGDGKNLPALIDGLDRDRPGESHAWEGSIGSEVEYRWDHPVTVVSVRLVFDSHLNHDKRMPCSYPQSGNRCLIPSSLVRSFRIQVPKTDGHWQTIAQVSDNVQRLVRLRLGVVTSVLRLVVDDTWGDSSARVFAFEPQDTLSDSLPQPLERPAFSDRSAQILSADRMSDSAGECPRLGSIIRVEG